LLGCGVYHDHDKAPSQAKPRAVAWSRHATA
jgi:hypothetical protein